MSRSTASRHAAGEPGREKTTRPARTPAWARESIAAEPISWYERARNSSPKPGRRFSSKASIASKVWSRGVMPVPPVKITAWTLGWAQAWWSTAWTWLGSSRTR